MKKFSLFMFWMLLGLICFNCSSDQGQTEKTRPPAASPESAGQDVALNDYLEHRRDEIAKAQKMPAEKAYPLAKTSALDESPDYKLTAIISGPDISETGDSGYWEFHFQDAKQNKEYTITVMDAKIDPLYFQETDITENSPPVKDGWISSKIGYTKSLEHFKIAHPHDWQKYSLRQLEFKSLSDGRAFWVLFMNLPAKKPVGSLIDAFTGNYIGEVKQ